MVVEGILVKEMKVGGFNTLSFLKKKTDYTVTRSVASLSPQPRYSRPHHHSNFHPSFILHHTRLCSSSCEIQHS